MAHQSKTLLFIEEATKKMLRAHVKEMSELQNVLYASNRYAVLLIFQAMDAAGKDSAIKHVMSGVNPQGCQVFSFKHPSMEELDHDFLWRTARALPERGRIGIFNRSHYEEVLIVRVIPNSYAPKVFRTKRSTTRRSGVIATDRSVISRRICTATARVSSSSFSIFPRKSSANAFLPASKSRIKTGNSAGRTSKKGNIGTITWMPMKLA